MAAPGSVPPEQIGELGELLLQLPLDAAQIENRQAWGGSQACELAVDVLT